MANRTAVGLTLIADTRRGNRPSFTEAAPPELAEPLCDRFCDALADEGIPVERGGSERGWRWSS